MAMHERLLSADQLGMDDHGGGDGYGGDREV
jgi:hypothetical protein